MMTEGASIHPTAQVSPEASIGSGVRIGPFSIVHGNVVLGQGSIVGAYCELGIQTSLGDGSPLIIGANSHIRSHSIFYESSQIGDGLITGHRVCVREMAKVGISAQIGSASDIQGHCKIGDYFRSHNSVHVGQKSVIGNCVWMFPDVLLTNDPNPPSEYLIGPVIGDYAVLASRATVLPGVKVGAHTFIGAHSLVGKDIPDGKMAIGSPAEVIGNASIMRMKNDVRVKAYPWNQRFFRGYPEELVLQWKNEQ